MSITSDPNPGSCIVVGAGPGIGGAVARRFAGAGLPIGLIARTQQSIDAAGADSPASALADATDPSALGAAIDHLVGELGAPGVLVYNVSVLVDGRASALDADTAMARLAADVGGPLTAVHAVHQTMAARGHGSILLTGGGFATHPSVDYASLSVGKAALRTLTQVLHEDLAQDGVHVATVTVNGLVAPGTAYDPDLIAEAYWELHTEARDAWRWELSFG